MQERSNRKMSARRIIEEYVEGAVDSEQEEENEIVEATSRHSRSRSGT